MLSIINIISSELSLQVFCNFVNTQDKIACGNATTIDDSTNQVVMFRCNEDYIN